MFSVDSVCFDLKASVFIFHMASNPGPSASAAGCAARRIAGPTAAIAASTPAAAGRRHCCRGRRAISSSGPRAPRARRLRWRRSRGAPAARRRRRAPTRRVRSDPRRSAAAAAAVAAPTTRAAAAARNAHTARRPPTAAARSATAPAARLGLGAPRLVDLAAFSFSRSSFRRSFSAFRWRSRLAASSARLLRAGALVESAASAEPAISGADADGCSEHVRVRPLPASEASISTPRRRNASSSPRSPFECAVSSRRRDTSRRLRSASSRNAAIAASRSSALRGSRSSGAPASDPGGWISEARWDALIHGRSARRRRQPRAAHFTGTRGGGGGREPGTRGRPPRRRRRSRRRRRRRIEISEREARASPRISPSSPWFAWSRRRNEMAGEPTAAAAAAPAAAASVVAVEGAAAGGAAGDACDASSTLSRRARRRRDAATLEQQSLLDLTLQPAVVVAAAAGLAAPLNCCHCCRWSCSSFHRSFCAAAGGVPPLLLQPDALIVVQERLRGVWRTLRLLLGVLHDGPDREVGRVRLIGRWQWLVAVVHVVERRDQVVDRIADRHVGAKLLFARREEVDRARFRRRRTASSAPSTTCWCVVRVTERRAATASIVAWSIRGNCARRPQNSMTTVSPLASSPRVLA